MSFSQWAVARKRKSKNGHTMRANVTAPVHEGDRRHVSKRKVQDRMHPPRGTWLKTYRKQVQRTRQEKKRTLRLAISCGENNYWDTYCLDKGYCAHCAGDLMRGSEAGSALSYDSYTDNDDSSEEVETSFTNQLH